MKSTFYESKIYDVDILRKNIKTGSGGRVMKGETVIERGSLSLPSCLPWCGVGVWLASLHRFLNINTPSQPSPRPPIAGKFKSHVFSS